MIKRMLLKINKQQGGFTLIELLIGVVVVSLISISATMVLGVMLKVNASSSKRVTAIRQVQNAGMWITQDVQSAQTITIGGSHFLEVLWMDWDGTQYKVDFDYDAVVTNDLVRKYYIKPVGGTFPVNPNTRIVAAHYIDQAKTSFVKSGSVYKLTVTAKITGFSASGQPISETRTYEILPRTGS